MFGVSQGSFLGSSLFNIQLCDLFFIINKTDFASYADANMPYRSSDLPPLITSLGGGAFLKIKKGGESMVQGQVFLNRGANTFPI